MTTKIERMEELVRQKEAFLFEKQTQAREAEQGLAAVQAKADGTEERLLVRSVPAMPFDKFVVCWTDDVRYMGTDRAVAQYE